MSITQLQAVVHSCRKILDAILNNNSNYQLLSEEGICSLIKMRKEEIGQLKVELQLLKREQKDKQQLARYIAAIEIEIEKVRKLNVKQIVQKQYLQALSQKNRLKAIDQNQRMAHIHQEQQIMQQFQLYIQDSIQNKNKYEELRQKLDGISSSIVKQKKQQNKIVKEKQQLLREVKQNHIVTDTKIAFLQNQISLQQQIIKQISKIQQKQTPYPTIQSQAYQILNREGQAIFSRQPGFDIWERHEIKNVLLKRQFEEEKQKRRIGSIIKQPISYTQHQLNDRTIKRRPLNHSADLTKQKKEVQQLRSPVSLGPVHFISKQRMKQIQKNKRIKTRFTPKAKVKPFVVQPIPQETSFLQSKYSILNTYQSFLKEKMKQKPSIIKFKRKDNKRRVVVEDNKGVAIQAESFD